MKNLKTKIFILLALCGCLDACKKSEDKKSVFFPQTLYANQFNKKTEVILFTKTGQILDTAIINKFIKNETNFNLQNKEVDANEQMVFDSKSIGILGNPKVVYDLNSDFANRKTEFIFYSQKQYPVNPQDLAYLLLKFKAPLKRIGDAPNVSHTAAEVRVANGNYLDLNFEVLSYKIKQDIGIQSGTKYNQAIIIDANALAQLKTTDTVAIQEFNINYKAK